MEYHGRRNRRGRDRRSRQTIPQAFVVPRSQRSWSVIDVLSSFFIMTSLLAIIYLMLDYHYTACNNKCDLSNITLNIDDISKNMSYMKHSYHDLETKVIKFSHDLTKIEGQLEVLEAIANKAGSGDSKENTEFLSVENVVITPKCGSKGNITENFTHKNIQVKKD